MDIRIHNATIVNEDTVTVGDVHIHAGRIAAVGTIPAATRATPPARDIDATGLLLLPGLIDDQVHFRQPGPTHKADIATESRAAVAGGVTTYMEMPNTAPPATTLARLEEKYAIAARVSRANYSFYLGATNEPENRRELARAAPRAICGIKVFMGSSTGNMLVDAPAALDAIFRDAPMLVATHCEDTPTIRAAEATARARHGDDIPPAEHPRIRTADACYRSTALAIEIARRHNTRLHILHISTAAELPLFAPGPLATKRITAEACVHHLWFTDNDYARLGNKIKCNPAIKTAADRDALRRALLEDRLDVIATDHAPHTLDEKLQPYLAAPSGLPLVQHSLPLLLELWKQGILTLPQIVRKTSHAVADLFQIRDRGYIRPGYHADLVLVNPAAHWTVAPGNIHYKCGWSPLEGQRFQTRVHLTLVNGQIAYENPGASGASAAAAGGACAAAAASAAEAFPSSPAGQRLEFAR